MITRRRQCQEVQERKTILIRTERTEGENPNLLLQWPESSSLQEAAGAKQVIDRIC